MKFEISGLGEASAFAIKDVGCSVGGEEFRVYRGTSLIRNTPLLGPYRRTIPGVLCRS